MTTTALYILIVLAFGFGLIFIITIIQMANIDKLINDNNDLLACIWVLLGYLDKESIRESQKRINKRIKKSLDTDEDDLVVPTRSKKKKKEEDL